MLTKIHIYILYLNRGEKNLIMVFCTFTDLLRNKTEEKGVCVLYLYSRNIFPIIYNCYCLFTIHFFNDQTPI